MEIKKQYGAGRRAGMLIGAGSFAVLMLALVAFTSASGFIEAGKSHFIRPADGIWWQGGYPHEFSTDSQYLRIGYENGPWRISAFNLGNYKTSSLSTGDEVRYYAGQCDVKTCAPPDEYTTRGSVRGLLFSGIYRLSPFFIEGGASITRQKFNLFVNVTDDKSLNGPAGRFYSWADTHTAVGYMASVGIEYKNFTFSFSYWLNDKASEFYAAGSTPGIDTVKTFAFGWRF